MRGEHACEVRPGRSPPRAIGSSRDRPQRRGDRLAEPTVAAERVLLEHPHGPAKIEVPLAPAERQVAISEAVTAHQVTARDRTQVELAADATAHCAEGGRRSYSRDRPALIWSVVSDASSRLMFARARSSHSSYASGVR